MTLSELDGVQNAVKLSYIKESEEMRLAVQPWKLIKRVKEIEQDGHAEPETAQQKDTRQTAAAVDLSKRLQDFRSLNNASTLKALEEWRKRKMERARQCRHRKLNVTPTSEKEWQSALAMVKARCFGNDGDTGQHSHVPGKCCDVVGGDSGENENEKFCTSIPSALCLHVLVQPIRSPHDNGTLFA
ncbi:hypothetical protein OIU85_024736 [Salix viminalis]|uniref:Uncharacterized protein n=1 Tax=Salix viminalis TaxID=40686 RepID=A0A9Q0U1E0_SALVM|nr:hypothetical protein OIU85_024736 [Salix viminalis]